MAAGAVTAFHEGLFRLLNRNVDFINDTIVATLHDNALVPNLATQLTYNQVSSTEIADADYAPITLTSKAISKDANGRTVFNAAHLNYGDAVTISARYVIIRRSTGTITSDPLLWLLDLNAGGSANVASTASDFDVTWNADGLYRVVPG